MNKSVVLLSNVRGRFRNGIKFTKPETLEKERAIDERKMYEIDMACAALKLETQ